MSTDTGGLSKVQLQVMWNRLQAVVDEQASALMRTAFSPIVRESGDLSAGVFDAEGRMLTQAVTGTPGHVNTMAAAVRNFFPSIEPATMRPDDIYVTNDPWLGTGHLNDFVLVKPCFFADKLIGFVACTSHLVDIGGECMGPDGSDVFDEGLYVPPLRLLDRGELNATFMALLAANSRDPQQSVGDVHALITCSEVGNARLRDMLADAGLAGLDEISRHIISVSRDATRSAIRAVPDGVYTNEMTADGFDFELTLRATITIRGEDFKLDFAGTSGLSRHGINCPLNYAEAYTVFGVKCIIAPGIPNNAGSLAPFVVAAPERTIVNAPKPVPVNSRHIVGQLLPDVALGCLHQALPDQAPAEGASVLWDLPIRGATGRGAHPYAIELVHNGGTGARPGRDGLSATAFPSGVMGSLVEITESVTPLLILRRELCPDSGGPGRFRGGMGQEIEVGSGDGSAFTVFGTVDRIKHPARGRVGGFAGRTGDMRLASGTVFMGKGRMDVPPGDRLLVRTPGGGGYGHPLLRDPCRVALDVARDLVSRRSAERDYGVIVDGQGQVDAAATADLRRACQTGNLEKGHVQ